MSEDLGNQAYRGKVVVLVNERTGSAAEGFAWDMKEIAQATRIWEPGHTKIQNDLPH